MKHHWPLRITSNNEPAMTNTIHTYKVGMKHCRLQGHLPNPNLKESRRIHLDKETWNVLQNQREFQAFYRESSEF